MTDMTTAYRAILAVALTQELITLLDRIELLSAGDRVGSFKAERLNLKRAREMLDGILTKLDPPVVAVTQPDKKVPLFKAQGT